MPTTTFPERLTAGYCSFLQNRLIAQHDRYRELAEQGQNPDTLVIGCCDSRAMPEIIFDAGPGEVFVIRNVAAQVPPFAPDDRYHGTSAALEFAVQALRVRNIVVLGHARCGGVNAYLRRNSSEPLSPGDFIGKWITLIEPAYRRLQCTAVPEGVDEQQALEWANVTQALENLRTFPCVKILEQRGKLKLHGAWFDIASAALHVLEEETGTFHQVLKDLHHTMTKGQIPVPDAALDTLNPVPDC